MNHRSVPLNQYICDINFRNTTEPYNKQKMLPDPEDFGIIFHELHKNNPDQLKYV